MAANRTIQQSASQPREGVVDGTFSPPECSGTEWVIALLLFVGTCLYYRIFYRYTNLNGDEGIVLQGAQRILEGEVLYRDFFYFLTPGSFYWTALLFKVFGNSILVARGALIFCGGIFSVLTYLLARRVCARWCAIFVVYLFTLTCIPSQFRVLHNWDSTFWACLALYFAVRLVETPHWGFALAVGAFASLTCLFEQSKGAGLLLGLAAGFGAVAWTEEPKGRLARLHIWALLAGFLPPLLLTVAYFGAHHSLPQMLADCLWPLQHYSSANTLPYGAPLLVDADVERARMLPWGLQLGMLFIVSPYLILPVLPILAVGFVGLFRLWRENDKNARYFVMVSTTLVAIVLPVISSGRPDLGHLIIFNGPLCFLVLAWTLERSLFPSKFLNGVRALGGLYLFFSFTALGLTLLWGPVNAHLVLKTRRGFLSVQHGDAIIEELQARVRPGQKVFVYPYQPLYYYLTSTFSPTHYDYLQLGMHTPEQFGEAIRELAADHTPVVVFQPSFTEFIPQGWPATPTAVLAARDTVAEYILSQYRPCETLTSLQTWQFVFLVRKDLSCTGPL